MPCLTNRQVTGWRRVRAAWPEVERMRVVRDRRAELLELDLGHTVVLLSRTRMDRLPAGPPWPIAPLSSLPRAASLHFWMLSPASSAATRSRS